MSKRRRRASRATFDTRKLQAMCDDGDLTWQQIAEALGVSRSAVTKYARRHNIHKRRRPPRTALQTFMRWRGLTARALAEAIQMHPTSVQRVAAGRSPTTYGILGRVAARFGSDPSVTNEAYIDMIAEEAR